jgi:hypothetical protein
MTPTPVKRQRETKLTGINKHPDPSKHFKTHQHNWNTVLCSRDWIALRDSYPTSVTHYTINHISMPPRKQKQLASASASTSSNENMTTYPAPSAVVPTKTGEEQTHTPQRSPEKRSVLGITEAQKQALMDNLQLEGKRMQKGKYSGRKLTLGLVTERARKLRAQYALQAQGLRSRLEMRVNRIPQALRKRNIQDLLDEYANNTKPKPTAPLAIMDRHQNAVAPSATRKSLKRTR